MQQSPEKTTLPNKHNSPIKQILDKQKAPKRDLIYSTPDAHKHSPEKPPQKHPDITGPYGPMSDVATDAGQERADSQASNPFNRMLKKVTRDVDAWSDNTEKAYEAVQHKIDPDRPAVQHTAAVVGQPNRAVFSPQAKDSPNDVVSHVFTVAVFAAEAGRRAAGLVRSHRKADLS